MKELEDPHAKAKGQLYKACVASVIAPDGQIV